MIIKHRFIAAKQKKRSGQTWRQANDAAIGSAMEHMKYIQHRPGEDKEKGRREFFNETEDNSNPKDFKQKIKEMGSRGVVLHKVTLAPDVDPDDAQEFTREVMKKTGADLGLELEWQAVVHRNTDNHHVHVVVLGKDKRGKQVSLTLRDFDLMKEYGDKYLDREQPFARMEKKIERDERQQRIELERKERRERGEELPWHKKKVLREHYEPYSKWSEKQEAERTDNREKLTYLGKEYAKDDSMQDLLKGAKSARENRESYANRMTKKDRELLAHWIENKDRERYAGCVEKELAAEIKRQDRAEGTYREEGLSWKKQKIIREQLEPYTEWKRKQLEDEIVADQLEAKAQLEKEHQWDLDKEAAKVKLEPEKELEQPEPAKGPERTEPVKDLAQEPAQEKPQEPERKAEPEEQPIYALGKKYTKENSLKELRDLNEELWKRQHDDWIPPEEYARLLDWMAGKKHKQERHLKVVKDEPEKDLAPQESENKKSPDPDQKIEPEEAPIYALGKKYTKENSLEELRDLNDELWERGHSNWISQEEYTRLMSWMDEKRGHKREPHSNEAGAGDRSPGAENREVEPRDKREKFEYLGKEYRKDNKLEELFEASKLAGQNKYSDDKRMDRNDMALLKSWIEDKDRERFSGILDKEMAKEIKKQKGKERQQAEPQRWVDPDSERLQNNPIMGGVLAANAFVKSVLDDIPNDWTQRDQLKDRYEAADARLKDAKHRAGPAEDMEIELAIKDLNTDRLEAERAIKKRKERQFQDKLKQKEEAQRELREDDIWY